MWNQISNIFNEIDAWRHTNNEHCRLGPIGIVESLCPLVRPVATAWLASMLCTNRPPVENVLFVSFELLQSGVEGEDFPVASLFNQADQTLTSTVDCIYVKEELDADHLTIRVNGCELWCSDYVGCIHGDVLKSEAVSRRCCAFQKIVDARRSLESTQLPGESEMVSPKAIVEEQEREVKESFTLQSIIEGRDEVGSDLRGVGRFGYLRG